MRSKKYCWLLVYVGILEFYVETMGDNNKNAEASSCNYCHNQNHNYILFVSARVLSNSNGRCGPTS